MEGTVCIRLFSHPFGMEEEEEEEEEPIYASHFLFSTAMCRRLSLSLSIFDNSFSFGSWRGWRQWAEEWAGSCRLRFSLFQLPPRLPVSFANPPPPPPLYTHTLSFTLLPLFIYQGETSFLSRHSPGDALSLRTFSSPPHYLSFSSSAKLFQLLCFLAIYLTACVCRALPRV